MNNGSVVLFDGECALCNRSVLWLLARERRQRYCFASLQSDIAQPLLQNYGIKNDLGSVVVIDDECVYQKSDAIFHLLNEVRRPWLWLRVFKLIPHGLRDSVYDFIGSSRYRWWGAAPSCVIDNPAWHTRRMLANTASATVHSKT